MDGIIQTGVQHDLPPPIGHLKAPRIMTSQYGMYYVLYNKCVTQINTSGIIFGNFMIILFNIKDSFSFCIKNIYSILHENRTLDSAVLIPSQGSVSIEP